MNLEIKQVKVYPHSPFGCGKSQKRKDILVKLFDQTLPIVAQENRYGFALNKKEDLDYVKELFVEVASDDMVFNKLMQLKNWDFYSFIHTFDVFVLGNLFAKYLDFINRKTFARGTLLFDIGKMKIPKEILQKKALLTESEKQFIRRHTVEGERLFGDQFSDEIKEMIVSHHERLDGSGYPNQRSGVEINQSVRMLSILDVYSSLTLKRVDREALSAPKALEFLLSETNKFDELLLFKFMEFLHIFPRGSSVLLSNSKLVKIIDCYRNAVFIPKVSDIGFRNFFYLPLDLSVSVKKFVSWDEEENKTYEWDLFFDYLKCNQEHLAFKIFEELSFDQTSDHVYRNIVNPALKELEQRQLRTEVVERIFMKWMDKKCA